MKLTLPNILLLKSSNISTDHKSKMVWNKRHNLQIRLVQFTGRKRVWIGTNSTNRTFHKYQNCGIYWLYSYNLLTNKYNLKSSKQLKKVCLYMSVLNTFQYKQCLCFLTLSVCNEWFVDQTWIIYRPEEKN